MTEIIFPLEVIKNVYKPNYIMYDEDFYTRAYKTFLTDVNNEYAKISKYENYDELRKIVQKDVYTKMFLTWPNAFYYDIKSFSRIDTYYSFFKKCNVWNNTPFDEEYNTIFKDASKIRNFCRTNLLTHSWKTEIKLISKILGAPYAREVV